MVKCLAARDPISFFGTNFKPAVGRKPIRKDADRLTAIYNQVHQFSQMDVIDQLIQLKTHLISVGGQRRSSFRNDI